MAAATHSLLVELLVEELPPKALRALGEAFSRALEAGLRERRFLSAASRATAYATPRRLAVHLSGVRSISEDREVPARKLMLASVGLDASGKPAAPLVKKLRELYDPGVDVAQIFSTDIVVEVEAGKPVLKQRARLAPGVPLAASLEGALEEALGSLPIPKLMTYQLADGWTSVQFARPAHGLVALHGDAVVPVRALGLRAGRTTRGHRFEAAIDPIELRDADAYERQLADDGAVIAGFDARRAEIERQLGDAAAREGLRAIDDAALLDEVSALVEWPNVLMCGFDAAFLAVPPECLILTMKANQKYFPLLDAAGTLTSRFLVVSNIRPADASRVVEGNQRVVRPRLADAKFFFDQDRKRSLDSRVPALAGVVYHGRLGTQGERVGRVRAIARAIGEHLGGAALTASADRAARLAKADLLTDMVGEFAELQGVMGGYYARHDGEPDEVAFAIEDHYKPRFAGDALPRGATGVVVALADKLETMLGLFQVGERPTGDKDPFALRRHALGIIRMLVERALPLPLDALLETAATAFSEPIEDPAMVEFLRADAKRKGNTVFAHGAAKPHISPQTQADVAAFVFDRLAASLREQGYSAQELDAVLALRPQRLAEVPRRLAAVRSFAALPESVSLAAANKRVGNILKKADGAAAATVDKALLREAAETALDAALGVAAPKADAAFERGDYSASLQSLAALKNPVDAFFDQVMVNTDDPALRANRLGLLAQLHAAMNRVADLSKLAA